MFSCVGVQRRLTVVENRVEGKIFGPKSDRVTGEWRRLHNEELHDLFNARHPDVLLKTIKIYKYRQNPIKFIILYHFWTTCFDCLESSSGPLVN